MPWQDISDSVLEVGDPTAAEIGAALRERDRANASKALPMTYSLASGAQCLLADGWKTSLTLRVFVPHDLPSGWVLWLPYQLVLHGTTANPAGSARLKIGSTIGVSHAFTATTPVQVLDDILQIVVPDSARGTEIDVEIQCQTTSATSGDYSQANPPVPAQAARFSIRRP